MLNFVRIGLSCTLALLIIGCGTFLGAKPQAPVVVVPGSVKPPVAATPRERIPRDDECGEELDPRRWEVQCASTNLAMMCRKSDRTDRRCARKKAGKYRWTYGSYCAHALTCYRRACN